MTEPRWYCITSDGAATLCVDRADAEQNAADADIQFPRRAPHRAVQLVEAAPQPQQAAPAGYVLAPEYRGYALLGSGNYRIDHSAEGAPAELVISIATEADKLGRAVGDERDNPPGDEIQPEQMAVRICFQNVGGLDALEKQLCYLRNVHFPTPPPHQAPAPQPVWLTDEQIGRACGLREDIAPAPFYIAVAHAVIAEFCRINGIKPPVQPIEGEQS